MWCGLNAFLANIDIRRGTHKFDIIYPVVNRRVFLSNLMQFVCQHFTSNMFDVMSMLWWEFLWSFLRRLQ